MTHRLYFLTLCLGNKFVRFRNTFVFLQWHRGGEYHSNNTQLCHSYFTVCSVDQQYLQPGFFSEIGIWPNKIWLWGGWKCAIVLWKKAKIYLEIMKSWRYDTDYAWMINPLQLQSHISTTLLTVMFMYGVCGLFCYGLIWQMEASGFSNEPNTTFSLWPQVGIPPCNP